MGLAIDLTGRNVLLTGGSKGIGAATVRLLHQAGAKVFFTYLSDQAAAQNLSRELGDGVSCAQCDIGDSALLPSLIGECVARLGSLDVLVNNAAIFSFNPFDGADYETWRGGWQHTFAVNLFGAADLTFLALREMRRQRCGKIINVASRSAHRGELSFPDYGASKAALVNLTKSLARSCAKDGIVSIAIAPGFIETEMAAEELKTRRAEVEAEIPSRRVGTPQEVASIIAFFASDLGNYANGAVIDVNAGSYVR
ncbi:MAG: SDR family oxidoreductase [Candidatus Eremiobacteraeota bacterium]|nr:SDR family oxidoreductase [Candidatus Eremiobacteraeota bacterium]